MLFSWSQVLLSLVLVNHLSNTDASYNLIHCQSDLWCYQEGSFAFEGNARKACENIDPLQPNYIEREILQLMNFARLFKDEWQERYFKTVHEDCDIVPVHPLWEHRGATEPAHFMSVANRDCSQEIRGGRHWTCSDYCYLDASEARNVFKPFEGCKVADRKSWFQFYALRVGSYSELFNSRKIAYQGEAICDSYWPCTDEKCDVFFKPERFLVGVGRALGTLAEPNPESFIVGTRAFDIPDSDTVTNQIEYWKTNDASLYRIPSASHFDKCVLDGNCDATTEWRIIVFQLTYAHHSESYIENTCLLHYMGQQFEMTILHTHTNTHGATWAVFETQLRHFPTSCESYFFTIQAENGVTYRLPEDPQLEFATTGNGCHVNHYTDGQENCPGEDPTQEGTRFDTEPPTTSPPTTSPPTTSHPVTSTPTTTPLTTPPTTPLPTTILQTTPPTTTPPTTSPPTTTKPTTALPSSPTPSTQEPTTTSSEYYGIATPVFNLCLNIRGSRAAGNPIVYLWNCNGNDNQMWYMDNFGFVRSKLDSSKCLTMHAMTTTLTLSDCATTDFTMLTRQLWYWDSGKLRGMYESDRCVFWNSQLGRPARVHQCINGDIRFYWALI